MLNATDLPIDPSQIGQETMDLVEESVEGAAELGVLIGQLDPTEVDLSTGLPRWNEEQRSLILRFNDKLEEWREE